MIFRYATLARKLGVLSPQLEELIVHGACHPSIAKRIGSTSMVLNDFIAGSVTPAASALLGISFQDAHDLRKAIDRQGAIGVVIGLLMGAAGSDQSRVTGA